MSARQQKVIAKWQPQGQTETTFNLKDTVTCRKVGILTPELHWDLALRRKMLKEIWGKQSPT